ncbi:hypothetical protein [Streptomyces rimosus]|uniref:hypothetical protein n=1 Tax=Streptomyces rimosus TaxID=1927 RepID=UPI0004C79DA4|nr:hypothetical protein [Streptomyces rimosus]
MTRIFWEGGCDTLLARRNRMRDTSVLWLVARRTGMGPGSLDVLMNNPHAVSCRVELGPVAPGPALRLAGDVLGAPPTRKLSRMLARAGGNPGLLVALSRGLLEEGSVQVAGGWPTYVRTGIRGACAMR